MPLDTEILQSLAQEKETKRGVWRTDTAPVI